MANEETNTISLKELYDLLLSYKRIFIYGIVICLVLSVFYNTFLVAPTYTSASAVYINCMSDSDMQMEAGISQYEIESSRLLSTTYMEILLSRSFLESVSADIGYKYDWKQLSSMVRIASRSETEILDISVTSLAPEDSYIICKSIVNNAPLKMRNIFKRGTVEIVDEVYMPLIPSKPGLKKILIMGVGLGVVLAAAIVFLIEIFDTRVRSATDLSSRYDIIVLGEIVSE